MVKLAIISSHPIQYYAPWFRYLAENSKLSIQVFYLWNFGITDQIDAGFKQAVTWDIPLLSGYGYKFVPNTSQRPGTSHFWGLQNPMLLRQVEAYKPDAVLLMNYNYASLYRFILQWNRTPLLFRGDSHRLVPRTGPKEILRRQVITQLYRQFAALLYVGKANYAYFRYHGVPSHKLFFSPHAIDNDRFLSAASAAENAALAWKQQLGIPPDFAVVLFAGKFETKKRPLDLLRAFKQANLDSAALLFVGAGSLEAELRAQAADHPHIYFAPFQNQSLMPRTYAIADLVVLPSQGSQETWGLCINEAMCLARPVVASTHVGCAQDLVRPHENGLTVPAGDVDALSKALREALSDRDRLKQWGHNSREAIKSYSYPQATAGLEQALETFNLQAAAS